jgi:aryl-alcohol dehydrogenase-like predicted oxidoreductase
LITELHLEPDQRTLGPYAVVPIGFGAMQLTGPGVFGPPPDRREALLLLQEVVENGVNHIDTAQYYGPDVVNELIREALYPYPEDLIVVNKVGARRDDQGGIFAYDEPAQLRAGIEENLKTLGVESLPVVNLRLMRSGGPRQLLRRPARSHDCRPRRRPHRRRRAQ